MRKNLLRMELQKGFCNKTFLFSVVFMSVIACLSAVYVIEGYLDNCAMFLSLSPEGTFEKNYMFPVLSAYGGWIGGETRSLMQSLFFLILPIAAILPFGISFLSERRMGYLRNISVRTHIPRYYCAKAIACFCTGFAVAVIPLCLNFLLVSAVLPSAQPQINYEIYYLVYFGDFLSDLFYTHRFIYVLCYIALNGFVAGGVALSAFALAFGVKNRYVVSLLPFLFFLGIDYLADFVLRNTEGNAWGYEISLIRMLHCGSTRGLKSEWILCGYLIGLLGVSALVIGIRSKKDEVF